MSSFQLPYSALLRAASTFARAAAATWLELDLKERFEDDGWLALQDPHTDLTSKLRHFLGL